MKKSMIIVACVSTFFVHGMEINPLSAKPESTKFCVFKGLLFDEDGKVDLIVVGKNQQRLFKQFKASNDIRPGIVKYSQVVYTKNKDDSKCSKPVEKKIINSALLTVVEPCIAHKREKQVEDVSDLFGRPVLMSANEHCSYTVQRLSSIIPHKLHWLHQTFDGDEAIREAAKDLVLCYKNVLAEGLKLIGEKKERSIVFPTLSTEVGFPWEDAVLAAMRAIIEFIKENPYAYSSIKLCIKTQSEFDKYRKMFPSALSNSL